MESKAIKPKYKTISGIPGNCGLLRIIAVRDFSDVKAGDLGGLISSEDNLSHFGNCWIYDNARAIKDSRMYGNAMVKDNAVISSNAVVSENAIVSGNARVHHNAIIRGNANISDNAIIGGDSTVFNNVLVSGNTHIYHGKVCDNVQISIDGEVAGFLRGDSVINPNDEILCFYGAPSQIKITATLSDHMINVGFDRMTLDHFADYISYTHPNIRDYCIMLEAIRNYFN